MQELDQQTTSTANEQLRNWWVKLPMDEAIKARQSICKALKWSRQVWHHRLHGKSALQPSECIAINKLMESEILTILQ